MACNIAWKILFFKWIWKSRSRKRQQECFLRKKQKKKNKKRAAPAGRGMEENFFPSAGGSLWTDHSARENSSLSLSFCNSDSIFSFIRARYFPNPERKRAYRFLMIAGRGATLITFLFLFFFIFLFSFSVFFFWMKGQSGDCFVPIYINKKVYSPEKTEK